MGAVGRGLALQRIYVLRELRLFVGSEVLVEDSACGGLVENFGGGAHQLYSLFVCCCREDVLHSTTYLHLVETIVSAAGLGLTNTLDG